MTLAQSWTFRRERMRLGSRRLAGRVSHGWAEDQVARLSRALEEEVRSRTENLKVAADREHDLAAMMRRALLCPDADHRHGALRLSAATEVTPREALVGGDFHDFFPLDGGRIAIVLGDICGKGLVAAVQVPAVKFILRAYLSQGASPGESLTRLNAFLIERARLDRTRNDGPIALTLMVLDGATGTGLAASAGANPVIALRMAGTCEMIDVSGLPLGVLSDQSCSDAEIALLPGETLLLATDGLTEARHDQAMLYPEGLAQIALHAQREARIPLCSAGACFCHDLLQTVRMKTMDGARAFGGGAFRDDAAALLVRRCPGGGEGRTDPT